MRTHKLFSRFGLAMVAILLLSSMQHVYAAGTLAGTTITNVASVQYNAGVNVRNGTSNIITMVVGYKVVINLSPSNSSTTTVDSTSIYKAYTVTNTGNYADSLQFTVTHLPAGWIDTVFYDKDASGTETPGDSALTSGGPGFWTAISGSHALLLKITIPGYVNAPDNMIDSVTVTTASYGSGPGSSCSSWRKRSSEIYGKRNDCAAGTYCNGCTNGNGQPSNPGISVRIHADAAKYRPPGNSGRCNTFIQIRLEFQLYECHKCWFEWFSELGWRRGHGNMDVKSYRPSGNNGLTNYANGKRNNPASDEKWYGCSGWKSHFYHGFNQIHNDEFGLQ